MIDRATNPVPVSYALLAVTARRSVARAFMLVSAGYATLGVTGYRVTAGVHIYAHAKAFRRNVFTRVGTVTYGNRLTQSQKRPRGAVTAIDRPSVTRLSGPSTVTAIKRLGPDPDQGIAA